MLFPLKQRVQPRPSSWNQQSLPVVPSHTCKSEQESYYYADQGSQEIGCFPWGNAKQQHSFGGEPGSGIQENIGHWCLSKREEESQKGEKGLEIVMAGASGPGPCSEREPTSTPCPGGTLTAVCFSAWSLFHKETRLKWDMANTHRDMAQDT